MAEATGAMDVAEGAMRESEPAMSALSHAATAIDATEDVRMIDLLIKPLRAGVGAVRRA
jgi:hypothetical protein